MITSLLMEKLGVEAGIFAVPTRPRVAPSLAGFGVALPGARCGQHKGLSRALLSLLEWTLSCLQAHGRVSAGESIPC